MRVLIHACPRRMWYVEEFLVPTLRAQGADDIEVWNDTAGKGNLRSCIESFAARKGAGGTWHIQDDVLLSADFVDRCRAADTGVVYGFCCQHFMDDPGQSGMVHLPDAWHSFQCVRIPDAYAREFSEWMSTDAQADSLVRALIEANKGDDYLFTEFLNQRHAEIMVTNMKPCLVEHIDVLIGGSAVNEWRGYWARAEWFDTALVDELRERLQRIANNERTNKA